MFATFPERSGWCRNRLCTAFDVAADPQEVIIDFKESRGADMSAIEALNKLTERSKYFDDPSYSIARS